MKKYKSKAESSRGIYFCIGLIVSLSIVLMAFEWRINETASDGNGCRLIIVDNIEDEIIPITVRYTVSSPPPSPPKINEIKIVEKLITPIIEPEVEILQPKKVDYLIDYQDEIFIDDDIPIFSVEQMPTFYSCDHLKSEIDRQECTNKKVYSFVMNEIRYPSLEKDAGISGTVFLEYTINSNGNASKIKVLKGIKNGKELEREAIRALKSLPALVPGKQNGKAVSVSYTIPVKFAIK